MQLSKSFANVLGQLVSGLIQLIDVTRRVVSDLVNPLSRLSAGQILSAVKSLTRPSEL